MGKRFIKFRVFRSVLPTFQSCRSKDSSSAVSSAHKSTTPPPKPHHSSATLLKRHVSSAFLTARRSFLGPHSFPEDCRTQSSSTRFKWGKDPKWHIIAKIPENDRSAPPRRKIYTSAASEDENDVVLFPPLQLGTHRRRHPPRRFRGREGSRRRRSFRKVVRVSSSSDSGLFTDEFEERENSSAASAAAEEPARLSEFMRRVACRAVEGKVRESFAVVKRSEDPYEDFRRSMAEMVVEKRMFEAEELEELLRCFLELNSARHHDAIVRAFTEIWDALFSQSQSQSQCSSL